MDKLERAIRKVQPVSMPAERVRIDDQDFSKLRSLQNQIKSKGTNVHLSDLISQYNDGNSCDDLASRYGII